MQSDANSTARNTTDSTESTRHEYEKTLNLLARTKSRQVFLLKCRRLHIVPRFIMDRTNRVLKPYDKESAKTRNSVSSHISSLNFALLNIEIGICCNAVRDITSKIERLRTLGSYANSNETITVHGTNYKNALKSHNTQLHGKLRNLVASQGILNDIKFDESCIKNLTTTPIPNDVLTLLSLGPKFAVCPQNPSIRDLITDIECIVTRFTKEPVTRITRGQLGYTLKKSFEQQKKENRITRFLRTAAKHTQDFLRQNKNLMVTNSDKGSVTIIAEKSDYEDKMVTLLQGDEYEIISSDITEKCQKTNNRLVSKLCKEKFIDVVERKRLTTYTATAPRIFAQFKYHKPGNPVRPIVSTINSPAYKLSRYLATVLRKAFNEPKFNIKNSMEFLQRVKKTRIDPNNVLVSFDVVNCFSNIPTELALKLIERDFDKVARVSKIPKDMFIDLLRFCLHDCNFFKYNNLFYKQKFGLFMGSSLAPILVERVIEDAIVETMCKISCVPDFWFIYVDDNLTSLPANKIDETLKALNEYHPKVQLTMEVQENNKINFLDMTVYKHGSTVTTKWYHKPIASNRMLNYYSAHPRHTVINTAKAFAERALRLSSTQYKREIINKISAILEKNNFPKDIINKIIHEKTNMDITLNQTLAHPTNVTWNNATRRAPPKEFASLTYVPQMSEALTKQLKYFAPNVTIAGKPPLKNGRFFANMKAKQSLLEKSGCVYKLECTDCDKIYIGETQQKLGKRVYQHQYDVEKKKTSTALAAHSTIQKHKFDFDNVSILCRERIKQRLQIQEINHIIQNEEKTCNFKTDSSAIGPLYYCLLKANNT